jgi:hypothetical protein
MELLNAKQIDHFILSKGSEALAAFYNKYGPKVIDSQSLCVFESALKISTGREMLNMDFPLNRFFFIVFITNFSTLFWDSIFSLSTNLIPI